MSRQVEIKTVYFQVSLDGDGAEDLRAFSLGDGYDEYIEVVECNGDVARVAEVVLEDDVKLLKAVNHGVEPTDADVEAYCLGYLQGWLSRFKAWPVLRVEASK